MNESPSCPHQSSATQRPIRRVAIFGKGSHVALGDYVLAAVRTLESLGVICCLEQRFVKHFEGQSAYDVLSRMTCFDELPADIDLVLSVGGDGTFLHTACCLQGRPMPILGIHAGRLGFLAEVTPDQADHALRQVVAGHYSLSTRTLLSVSLHGTDIMPSSPDIYPLALNEIAVLKHDNSSLIEIETLVNGQLMTNYLADGLIVSTPTGSTGYALSVGGPVIEPATPIFVLAPVAPHSLTMRPVVLSDESRIDLRITSRTGRYLLAIDGRSVSLSDHVTLTITKSASSVQAVTIEGNDYFRTLRQKMMWGVDQRNV